MHATNRVIGQRCIPKTRDTRRSEGPKSYDWIELQHCKTNYNYKRRKHETKIAKEKKELMHATEKPKEKKNPKS